MGLVHELALCGNNGQGLRMVHAQPPFLSRGMLLTDDPCTHILSSECFAMPLIGTSISSCTSDVVDSTADTTSGLERVVVVVRLP